MEPIISKDHLTALIERVNTRWNVHINSDDFKSANYSASSLTDILVQKVTDELNGTWSTDIAFNKLKSAISKALNIPPTSITEDTELNQLFPPDQRKSQLAKVNEAMGIQMDILKPNGTIYGILIALFFAGIPFSIGFDWFIGGISMIITGLLIYILSKTGNTFRIKTIGHLADQLSWKNYLAQKADHIPVEATDIRKGITELISK